MLRQPLPKNRPSRAGRSPAARLRIEHHQPPAAADALQSAIISDQLFVLSRDALVVGDVASGRIVRWNPAAERLFGYPAAQAIGRPMGTLMPAPVARLHHEQLSYYARTGHADALIGRAELPIFAIGSSGEDVRVEYSLAPLEARGQPTRYVLLTFRDARCDQRQEQHASAAARAESARREADMRLQHLAMLVADSTRELRDSAARARRTTARLVRMAASDRRERPDRLARLARVADCRVARLQRAIDDADEIAAIQGRAFELDCHRINLVPLAGRIVADVRSRAPAHKVKLASPQGLTALVDARRIERVLRDVIERAIRRNPRGCWIDIDLSRPLSGTARLEVRDYGRRLSPREREQLVNHAMSSRGWWLDRFIVEQHGGSIGLEWPAEGGVRVVISLPTQRVRNAHPPATAAARAVEAPG
jgi:PAS domain S-box-containing protein